MPRRGTHAGARLPPRGPSKRSQAATSRRMLEQAALGIPVNASF